MTRFRSVATPARIGVLAAIALCVPFAAAIGAGQNLPAVSIVAMGGPVVVYDYPRQRCDDVDLPDQPARAFRDAEGRIHLFASHYVPRALIGTGFGDLRRDCKPAFFGGHDPNPADYNDYGWLSGFATNDGTTIMAIIHNEFHGNEVHALCRSGSYLRCWENSITAATSHDGGNSFSRVAGTPGLIASLPYPYVGDQPHQFGYFNPTNIVRFGKFDYFFMSLIGSRGEAAGICLLRTSNVSDPTTWRGWDGVGFGVRFASPYGAAAGRPGQVCHTIGNGRLMFSLGSVSYYAPKRVFVMIMRRQRWEHSLDSGVPGVYFATSPDLIEWSEPARILSDVEASDDANVVQFYPSMLDAAGGDRDFQAITANPTLFSIQFDVDHMNQARQLLARPLTVRVRDTVERPSAGSSKP